MNRRAFIAAAPAVALAGPVAAEAETPVAALYRELEAAGAAEDAAYARDEPDEVIDIYAEIRRDIEQRLMAEPCQDARDFVIKVVAYTGFGIFALPGREEGDALWAEARALVAA